MNRSQQYRAQMVRYRTEYQRILRELRALKADRDRGHERHPDVVVFLNEWDWLSQAADPVNANQLELNSRSAEIPPPGASTAWVRSQQEQVLSEVRKVTRRVQAALRVPAEERVVPADKCACCGRRFRKPRS